MFLPVYALGGAGTGPRVDVDIKEVWFVGSHELM